MDQPASEKPKWGKPSTKPETAPARFLAKVIPEPNSGCWLWTGAVTGNGYGGFHDGERMVGPHHYSWRLHCGEIPDGMYVCHRCDTPLCVNPDHLFLGTPKDNQQDRTRKGRAMRTHAWVHPEELKAKIRADTRTYREIAEAHGVSFMTVKHLKANTSLRNRTLRGQVRDLENENRLLREALTMIATEEPNGNWAAEFAREALKACNR